MFQVLIGRLVTLSRNLKSFLWLFSEFQVLIGRLVTVKGEGNAGAGFGFQVLIGRLVTELLTLLTQNRKGNGFQVLIGRLVT